VKMFAEKVVLAATVPVLQAISKPCTRGWICDSCFPVEEGHESEQRQREGRWRDTVGY
jgi:hypothetical protein